nr:ABC transporter ATP-binding protein [Bacteroidota bacterium]
MASITLSGITKKFGKHIVFRNITTTIYDGEGVAIIGSNGSGKSTLLKVIAGYVEPSAGKVEYAIANLQVNTNNCYQHLSYAAPYMDLIEEFTLSEQVNFYFKFKQMNNNLKSIEEFVSKCGLEQAKEKQIKYFSSGMKQRLKLSLAIMSNSPYLFLDEPLTNLDAQGTVWYQSLMTEYTGNRIVIIGSNSMKDEIFLCRKNIDIEEWKN